MLETGEVEDTSCVLANATYAGRILRAGEGHVKPNADQCWQACKWVHTKPVCASCKPPSVQLAQSWADLAATACLSA